jgi:inhibitor of KinA sporulation pathway (predicted exonuclease)
MKYLIVIDFEANCIENKVIIPQEIIEFPAIPICIDTNTIEYDKLFHYYCNTDILVTEFATNLTGITQEMCDNGKPFKEVHKLFQKWLFFNGFTIENSIIVTCGDWDFKTAFPNQCKYNNIKIPKFCKNWCNVKNVYKNVYNIKSGSMTNMLTNLDIELEGKHHSGVDDTKNIAKICLCLLKNGGHFEPFVHSYSTI